MLMRPWSLDSSGLHYNGCEESRSTSGGGIFLSIWSLQILWYNCYIRCDRRTGYSCTVPTFALQIIQFVFCFTTQIIWLAGVSLNLGSIALRFSLFCRLYKVSTYVYEKVNRPHLLNQLVTSFHIPVIGSSQRSNTLLVIAFCSWVCLWVWLIREHFPKIYSSTKTRN